MPPRASLRRGSRGPSREPETGSPASNLQRPHLPELQGTPSSRRQYSYGAGVEPLPARPGRNLGRGQVMDLGSAVRDALIRQDEEEIQEEREIAQQNPRHPHLEEDELAGSSMPPPPPRTAISNPPQLQPPLQEWEIPDDARSFATESSFYGDATIISSPGTAPPLAVQQTSSLGGPSKQPSIVGRPSSSALGPDSRQQSHRVPTPENVEPPSQRTRASRRGASEQQDETRSNRPLGPQKGINTPAATRASTRGARAASEEPRGLLSGRPEILSKDTRRPRKPLFTIDDDTERPSGAGDHRESAANQQSNPTGRSNPPTKRNAQKDKSRRSRENGGLFPTDASEQDEAMQKDIEEAEAQAAREERVRALEQRKLRAQEERDREQAERVREQRERWAERWTWLKSQPPLSFFQPQPQRDNHDDDEDEEDVEVDHPLIDEEGVTMWQLLNPLTYARAMLWLFEEVFGSFFTRLFTRFSHLIGHGRLDTQRYLLSLKKTLPSFLLGLIVALLVPYLSWTLYQAIPSFGFDIAPDLSDVSWPSLGGVAGSIRNYVPTLSWPSSSWPSSSRWDDLPELGDLDNLERGQLQNLLYKYERELLRMQKTEKLHEASLKKLEQVVPKVVHMDKRNGKLVIEQDFWHALRDLLVEDGAFLSLDRKGSVFEVASERQWQAVASRLAKDPVFTTKLSSNVKEAESHIEKKWSSSWESWVKSNDGKIAKILGPQFEKVLSSKTDKQLLARVEKMLKESESSDRNNGQVVTRSEFLRHLQNEFSAHKAEIRAQLEEHQPQLEQLIRETVDMAIGKVPGGMTRAEITELVDGLVRKSIADMNLAAMAKGKIQVHWDHELKNQVNYFGIGAGATIDPVHSSVTYTYESKTAKKPTAVTDTLKKKGLLAVSPPPQISALLPWFDEGDCWCGAHSRDSSQNRQGASLSIQLGHSVVPRTVVIEHILSGATTDSGAAPRQVEVWAYIADHGIRESVRSFSHTHFARYDVGSATSASHLAPFPERFVRIGRFVYEGAERHDGVYVHQLSPELVSLGVETDQVIVRALTNYGDSDHTCFYRVRLYGQNVDVSEMLK